MSDYEIIRTAVLNKQQISAVFKGQVREFCPHVLGKKDGRIQVLGYQFGGASNSRSIEPSGSPANWRCMPLEGMSDVKVMGGTAWHTCEVHTQSQTCVDNIDVEVKIS